MQKSINNPLSSIRLDSPFEDNDASTMADTIVKSLNQSFLTKELNEKIPELTTLIKHNIIYVLKVKSNSTLFDVFECMRNPGAWLAKSVVCYN